MSGVSIGSFRLGARIAVGGMGEVWSGEHVRSGLPVALKVVRRDRIGKGNAEAEFEREIRQHARLDHPGVVYLFDHGRLDRDAARATELPEGSPWVAMEWCSSSLRELAPSLRWEGTHEVLQQLLDALAHAHASGVLHRDIKLANVLVSTASDARPGVKLADFGIAHALLDEDETTRSVGTPRYMAPEQFDGDWEQHGPWTDLYALGVLAWRLVTGERPWARLEGVALALAMLERPLGWPGARFPAPPGLSRWIDRLTAKAPSARYQCAADAAEALRAIAEKGSRKVKRGATMATLIPDGEVDAPAERAAVVRPVEDPPAESEATMRLHAAGLGLLALRRPAMIGRTAEREVAWALIRDVVRHRRLAVLSVTGPPRVGRTRFLAWLGETAERTGHGVSLVARCTPGRPLGDALLASMRAWFRVGPFERARAREHLRTWLGEQPWLDELAALLAAGRAVDASWIPMVRYALEALASLRPVVLRIERPDPGELSVLLEALGAIDAPVLVAVDVPVVGAVTMELGPLPDASMHRLAEAMVALDPDVRARLVARSAGSPGFLVQTLVHWAQQGLLEPGPQGFRVQEGAGMAPTLAVVAASRLNAVVAALPDGGLDALERAAVLGVAVDRALWNAVDGEARGALRDRVVEVLCERGVAEEVAGGWRFTSVPFREAVLEGGPARRAAHHARCAKALAARGRVDEELQLGHHRLAAGDVAGALGPLRRGVERASAQLGSAAGFSALHELERAVERLEGPSRLRWQAVLHELASGLHLDAGDVERAEQDARLALRTGEAFHDAELAARAWARLGAVCARRRDERGRFDAYRRALDLAREVPASVRARWWMELAKSHLARADLAAWSECVVEAGRCAEESGDPVVAHLPAFGRAAVAQARGDVDGALAALVEAEREASASGFATGRLVVLRGRAHALLDAGRLQEAREAFHRAQELAVMLHAPSLAAIVANAIALELRLGDPAAASGRFDAHRYLMPLGRDGSAELIPLHIAGVAIAALRGDWRAVTHHISRFERHGPWAWSYRPAASVCLDAARNAAYATGRRHLADDLRALVERRGEIG